MRGKIIKDFLFSQRFGVLKQRGYTGKVLVPEKATEAICWLAIG